MPNIFGNIFQSNNNGGGGGDGGDPDITEVPTGTKNGSNVTFTLTETPLSGSLELTTNGIELSSPGDYSIAGKTITYVVAPLSSDILKAHYEY